MTEQLRALFLKVIGQPRNDHEMHAIVLRLHFLDSHCPPAKLPFALAWLIDNRLTGSKFLEFVETECRDENGISNLIMQRVLLNKVQKEDERRVIAGRDFV